VTGCFGPYIHPAMVVGPAWTRGEIEKPAGEKNMGTWTAGVYTPEQQARLGVDEQGTKVAPAAALELRAAPAAAPTAGRCGAIGPAWTRGEIEKPAGTINMGTWTARVYTEEQKRRLGVDKDGNKVTTASQQPQTITPAYATALLSSQQLMGTLCKQYFKKYDVNGDNVLQLSELTVLCTDLHLGLGMSQANVECIKSSILPFSQGGADDQLTIDEFPVWFASVMKESIDANTAAPAPRIPTGFVLTVKALSGRQETLEVPLSMNLSELREAAAAALELPAAQTQLMIGERILSEGHQTLKDCDFEPGQEIDAIVVSTLKVRRHVYNMRGGAPPNRGYHLIATDEVDLEPNAPLGEQMDKLVPNDGYPGKANTAGVKLFAFQPANDGAPKIWTGGLNEIELEESGNALDTFDADGAVEVALLLPMRGMD